KFHKKSTKKINKCKMQGALPPAPPRGASPPRPRSSAQNSTKIKNKNKKLKKKNNKKNKNNTKQHQIQKKKKKKKKKIKKKKNKQFQNAGGSAPCTPARGFAPSTPQLCPKFHKNINFF